jgi:D-alanine-D-alanine ligase-like ATP-grasp enzyme
VHEPLQPLEAFDVVRVRRGGELRQDRVGGRIVGVVVEEMIEGKKAIVGVINNFRDRKTYILPSVEVRPSVDKTSCDFEEICPGNFTREEKDELEKLAHFIHTELNLDHYSSISFIIHPKKGIYLQEVRTLPSLISPSYFSTMFDSIGITYPEFIDHIIKLSLNRYKN